MSDKEIFEILFKVAKESGDEEGVVAAALVRKEKILIASPSSDDGVFHAEYLVLTQAKREGIEIQPEDVMYTTLEPCNRRSPGRPVSDCCTALIDAGIRRVVYAATDPAQTVETQQKLKASTIICEPVTDKSIIKNAREIFNSTQLNPNKNQI
jgi:pyrimidine deaminase RibD-like protein